jgi:hypothetical protein
MYVDQEALHNLDKDMSGIDYKLLIPVKKDQYYQLILCTRIAVYVPEVTIWLYLIQRSRDLNGEKSDSIESLLILYVLFLLLDNLFNRCFLSHFQ